MPRPGTGTTPIEPGLPQNTPLKNLPAWRAKRSEPGAGSRWRWRAAQVDWRGVHFFWDDERCVPPGHADSNYRPVLEPGLLHGR
ncbi:MAG: 6-phosphogluconolactonase [Anaerolineales bacterium]